MLNKKFWYLLVVLTLFAFLLVACNSDEGGDDPDDEDEQEQQDDNNEDENNEEEEEEEGPVSGGELVGAMDTAPDGIFNPIFYSEAYEANILDFTHESLAGQNDNLEFIPQLAEDWEANDDQTELTMYLREGVTWHDGEEFNAEDVIYTYTAIASPGYTEAGGIRTTFVQPLVGYEEFSSGEADTFEGVEMVDEYTVKFHFAEPNVNPVYYASYPIIPEHVFGDIPIEEQPSHPATLDAGEVIGTGPFKFTEMVEREEYVLTRHDDYWQGTPYLESIKWDIVDQSVITSLLESGDIDFVADPNGVPAADYEMVDGYENVEMIEQTDFGYQLMGFKMNYRTAEDAEAGTINPDNWVENPDVADQKVRQAIAYAINRQGMVEGLLRGRGSVINAPIAQQFWAYTDEVPQYEYSTEEAEALLDEAGYVDVNDDGFRENPDGEEWVLDLEYPTGNKIREDSAPVIKDDLEKVGIKVELRNPREMSAYSNDIIFNDSEEALDGLDLYLIGWSLGSGDPDPTGLWNIEAQYNISRWNNPESDELINKALQTPDAFDQEFRTQTYQEWQELFATDLPAVILYAQNKIYAYNERLNGVDPLPMGFINDPHLWWVEDAQ
ncbi:peptide-binding protein [Aquisalibacillus elongatus]|uniref:Peptide/nickel transport system substrate-binding protein n=1 Tax=Aquisalibacillus elongatus TaxID=485577 RepID=A0A3N5AYI3_9BACI|nr:peptide-binding protein [Aquisalibacillus elongatus]RPF50039.1 peptide/nickel transport system substrate-binding protein [Aquisalibacillus elongatus]